MSARSKHLNLDVGAAAGLILIGMLAVASVLVVLAGWAVVKYRSR